MVITIPGEPIAQARGRAFGFRRPNGTIGARVFDPKKSRNWKATAQQHMSDAIEGMPPIEGPVTLTLKAYFSCPKTDCRKTQPRPIRWHTKRPDLDNVLKAVKDAAKGVLWLDDCQVCSVAVFKMIAAQGEAPRLELVVHPISDEALPL